MRLLYRPASMRIFFTMPSRPSTPIMSAALRTNCSALPPTVAGFLPLVTFEPFLAFGFPADRTEYTKFAVISKPSALAFSTTSDAGMVAGWARMNADLFTLAGVGFDFLGAAFLGMTGIEPPRFIRSQESELRRLDLHLVLQACRIQLALDGELHQHRFGVPKNFGPLRCTLRAHRLTTLLYVTEVRLRDAQLLGALILRKFLALAYRFDGPTQGKWPTCDLLQQLHRVTLLVALAHGYLHQ